MRIHVVLLAALLLTGCSDAKEADWQLSLSAARSVATNDRVTLSDPDEWAVAVQHSPQRRAAVISTQRLLSEWPSLLGNDPVDGTLGGEPVSVSAPIPVGQGLEFPATASPGRATNTSLIVPYDRTLKNFFDLPPAVGWTYTVTFGPATMSETTFTATLTSPVTVAFEGNRARSLPTLEAAPTMTGRAFLVTLDNRTYSAVPITIDSMTLQGTTLTVEMQNSAPTAAFNRGALFVDGLPTPA